MNATEKIIVTLESEDEQFSYDQFNVTYESSAQEIVNAISGHLSELHPGFNLAQEYEQGNWTVKKADNSRNIHIFPKSTAGALL